MANDMNKDQRTGATQRPGVQKDEANRQSSKAPTKKPGTSGTGSSGSRPGSTNR